jgi:hypothetical protein
MSKETYLSASPSKEISFSAFITSPKTWSGLRFKVQGFDGIKVQGFDGLDLGLRHALQ